MLMTFLISVGVAVAISTVLALLVVFADATIGDYGQVKIKINEEKELEVDGGRSLLVTLKDEGVFIPSACGGRGACGLCLIKVKSGAGEILPTELPWLDEDQKKSGMRLSCQLKVKRDMAIEIPPELFNVKAFTAEVTGLTDLTYDIKQVNLKLLDPPQVEFKAGQFMQLEVPEYELTDEPVYRAYSLSSDPADNRELEFMIRLVPNGICTTYVHKLLQVGDKLNLNGPYGDFFLRDTDRAIICIAGGSGMAPIKSILLEMKRKQINRRTRFFFGARTEKDLFLLDEMAQLEKDLPNFQFVPALSKPEEGSDWKGDSGLITDVVDSHMESGDNVEAYLCGSPGMIKACVEVLTRRGVPEGLIYYDSFG